MTPEQAGQVRGYRIVQPLGKGGMGAVFVAEKIATRQRFAVKFLKEEYMRDETYLARFEREVQALLAIRHPHVVNVFDWHLPPPAEGGTPFVVMELLDGEGLDQLLRRERLLSPGVAAAIMLQMLDGLSAAHAVGLIHRDLGPSNVFMVSTPDAKPLVKILDFGLARPLAPDEEASDLTQAGTLLGKPAYVAPEMFLELPLDARSDLYACGMILFRMLAGRLPYKQTQVQTLWLERYDEVRRGDELPAVGHYASWIPEQLDRIVAKAVRRSPDDRYQSAEEMQGALLAIAPGVLQEAGSRSIRAPRADDAGHSGVSRPPVVRTATGGMKLTRPERRKAFPLAIAGGVAVAAAVTLVLAGILGRGGDDDDDDGRGAGGAAQAADGRAPGEGAAAPATRHALPATGALVTVSVEGLPAGSVVRIGGVEIREEPYVGAFEASAEPIDVTVRADGFEPYAVTVVPDRNVSLMPDLRGTAAPPGRQLPATRRDGGVRPVRPETDRPGKQPVKRRPEFIEELPL